MIVPYPEDEYLLWLGRVNYSVSYFEWSILGDLPHIPGLPSEFSIESLHGGSTGQIANALKNKTALQKVSDTKTVEWLSAAGNHLEQIAVARNSILHARPATASSGKQRLNRWDSRSAEFFMVEIDKMSDIVEDIDVRLRDMSDRRLI